MYMFFIIHQHHRQFAIYPVRIRVRIDPPHPRVSYEATEWGSPSDETGKTEALCHSKCGTIKIPPSSKALSAEHRPKF
jgi:hypothetical protein